MRIILASKSFARAELLRKGGFDFRVLASNARERTPREMKNNPEALVLENAKKKADAVLKKLKQKKQKRRNKIIVACDTVVAFDKKINRKPKSKKEAVKTLKKFSGKTHIVMSGLVVANIEKKEKIYEKVVKTKVKFRKLSDAEIIKYVWAGKSKGKAGSYGIQDEGINFVEKIDGSKTNVIGLPMEELKKILKIIESITKNEKK